MAGTLVTASAADLNILDGVTANTTELNLLDGGTTPSTVTIQDGDGIILNDSGVMKQILASDLKTYTATSSGVSKEATYEGDDLNIELTGNYNSSLILSSTGTSDDDALQLTTTSGGMKFETATNITINSTATTDQSVVEISNVPPSGSGHEDTVLLQLSGNSTTLCDGLNADDVVVSIKTSSANLGHEESVLIVDTSASTHHPAAAAVYIKTHDTDSQGGRPAGLLVDKGGIAVRETNQDKLMKFHHDGTNGIVETGDSGSSSGGGNIRFKNDILIPDGGNIGSSSHTDAISISTAGVVSMSATTGNTDSTDGALTVAGGVGIAENLTVGGNLTVTGTVAAATGSTIGNLTLADGSITSSSGAISFGNENLTTTGTVAVATGSTIGDLTLADGSITSSSGAIDFGDDNLTTTGNITCSSDIRLKKDIVEIDNCVDKVKKLRGVNFKWIKDDRDDFGVIAQEVEAIAPHAVKENKEGMKSVDYGRLTTLLIQAVKEQQTQIDELKDLVAKLTNKE